MKTDFVTNENHFSSIFSDSRAYSKPLSGATIAPNLVLWVLRKIFSLEMVKNDTCLGGASKKNVLFSENVPPKIAPIPLMYRIGPGQWTATSGSSFSFSCNIIENVETRFLSAGNVKFSKLFFVSGGH